MLSTIVTIATTIVTTIVTTIAITTIATTTTISMFALSNTYCLAFFCVMFTKHKICVNEKLNKMDKYINYLKYICAYNNTMSTRKQMNNATKSAKKYSSYFGGDSDGDNGNMSGGDERDPEVDYDDYESEAEDDSVANDKKSKPADGLDSGNEEPNEDSEDDEDEEEDQGEDEDEDEDLDAPIDTEDEDEDEDDESDEPDEEQGEEEDADGNVVSRP